MKTTKDSVLTILEKQQCVSKKKCFECTEKCLYIYNSNIGFTQENIAAVPNGLLVFVSTTYTRPVFSPEPLKHGGHHPLIFGEQ